MAMQKFDLLFVNSSSGLMSAHTGDFLATDEGKLLIDDVRNLRQALEEQLEVGTPGNTAARDPQNFAVSKLTA